VTPGAIQRPTGQRCGRTIGSSTMDPGGTAPSDDLDKLLGALDEADNALRALYRRLSEDPDLARDLQAGVADLHAQRLDLAQRVGLAALARRRAAAA